MWNVFHIMEALLFENLAEYDQKLSHAYIFWGTEITMILSVLGLG